ncbi:crossover junction endonuclease MUS81 [Nematocida sp. LUAm3]|nr:crossover junction endonuclease MUS81 [Nematocida sp. LUAm3]KAI5173511.1 crossover junction endonuclease MUS81 [Nematocida sp. LUAm2]KAI5176732.1 crossover junction endonuclease MUS81 [Nematocida sp. LUAm1]
MSFLLRVEQALIDLIDKEKKKGRVTERMYSVIRYKRALNSLKEAKNDEKHEIRGYKDLLRIKHIGGGIIKALQQNVVDVDVNDNNTNTNTNNNNVIDVDNVIDVENNNVTNNNAMDNVMNNTMDVECVTKGAMECAMGRDMTKNNGILRNRRMVSMRRIWTVRRKGKEVKIPYLFSLNHLIICILWRECVEQIEKIESITSLRYKCLMYIGKWKSVYGIGLLFWCTEKKVKESVKTLINHKMVEEEEGGVFPSVNGRVTADILQEYEDTWSNSFFYGKKEDILLIIDSRERNRRDNRFFFSNSLSEAGIPLESRMLLAGDFLWVCIKDMREAYMNVIVERKKIEDLISSLRDGRYKEQKKKLVMFPGTKIYLIEGEEWVYDISVIRTYFTVSYSLIFQGFLLITTPNIEKTLFFLSEATEFLSEKMKVDSLYSSNLSSLSSLVPQVSCKPSFSPKEKLISLICGVRGISYKVADAVSGSFSTIKELVLGLSNREELTNRISNIILENKKIGRKRASLIINALRNK